MKIGIIIAGFFAAVWWIVGIWVSGSGSALLTIIPFVISSAIIVAAMRQPSSRTISPAEGKRIGRLVAIASGIEGTLIGLTFANVGADEAIPIMAIIVGLHFLPLAYWIPARLYYATGALLTAIGLAALWVANVNHRILLVGIACACVLWLTCLFTLRPGRLDRRGTCQICLQQVQCEVYISACCDTGFVRFEKAITIERYGHDLGGIPRYRAFPALSALHCQD